MSNTLTAAQEGIQAGTWALDPVHSHVGFSVDYMAGSFQATFAPFDATLEVDSSGAVGLAGTARADGIKVQDENLAAHLLSPEFFDAEQTPELTFASRSFQIEGKDVAVEGDLTIKGISQPVRLSGTIGGPVVDPYGRERINVTLQGTVDRGGFGLDWNVPLPSGEPALANEVALSAELALIKG